MQALAVASTCCSRSGGFQTAFDGPAVLRPPLLVTTKSLRSGNLLVDPLQHSVHVCVYGAGDLC